MDRVLLPSGHLSIDRFSRQTILFQRVRLNRPCGFYPPVSEPGTLYAEYAFQPCFAVFPTSRHEFKLYKLFHCDTWLSYTFLVLQDLVVSVRAGVEDFILSFLGPAAVEVARLKQVLPSIHTLRALRGLRIQPVRTTTLLAPIKVIGTKYCYNSDICIALLLRIFAQTLPDLIRIQGVTGGTDQTSGECSLGQTIPI